MLNDNQEEIYDIIMNDEYCYAKYQNRNLTSAIRNAISLSKIYGNPIELKVKETKELKKYLKNELESEE